MFGNVPVCASKHHPQHPNPAHLAWFFQREQIEKERGLLFKLFPVSIKMLILTSRLNLIPATRKTNRM